MLIVYSNKELFIIRWCNSVSNGDAKEYPHLSARLGRFRVTIGKSNNLINVFINLINQIFKSNQRNMYFDKLIYLFYADVHSNVTKVQKMYD